MRAVELLSGYSAEPSALVPNVLNVPAPPIRFWPEGALDMNLVEAALIEAGRSTIKPAIERLAAAGMRVQSAVRLGPAAQTILSESLRQKAEAIVMGTRGHGALQGYALGSVALRVAHGGAAPLILVKPDDRLPGGSVNGCACCSRWTARSRRCTRPSGWSPGAPGSAKICFDPEQLHGSTLH